MNTPKKNLLVINPLKRPSRYFHSLLFFLLLPLSCISFANIRNVPGDFPTINIAIQNSVKGDTVLVQRGIYIEEVLFNKSLVLASNFIFSHDTDDIVHTIIDGGSITDSQNVITVRKTSASAAIYGFTIQNGGNGVLPSSKFSLLHNIIRNTNDGIDYETGSGGLCAYNIFTQNFDDGIDLDGAVSVDIFNNLVTNNGDDGIEIRFQPLDTNIPQTCIISGNKIEGNGEDGIQIIDYPGFTQRSITISNNLILNNRMAGLGVMDSGNSLEDYRGADILEEVLVLNNTFSGNNYGFCGGGNLIFKQNILMNSIEFGMRNNNTDNEMDYLIFFNNGINHQNSNIGSRQILVEDPGLDSNFFFIPGSIAVDRGDPDCKDADGSICDIGAKNPGRYGPSNTHKKSQSSETLIRPFFKFQKSYLFVCLNNDCNDIMGRNFPFISN